MLFTLFQKLVIYRSIFISQFFLPTPWFCEGGNGPTIKLSSTFTHDNSIPPFPSLAGSYGLAYDPVLAHETWEVLAAKVCVKHWLPYWKGTHVAGTDLSFLPPSSFQCQHHVCCYCTSVTRGRMAWYECPESQPRIWPHGGHWTNFSNHLTPDFLPCEEGNPLLSNYFNWVFVTCIQKKHSSQIYTYCAFR